MAGDKFSSPTLTDILFSIAIIIGQHNLFGGAGIAPNAMWSSFRSITVLKVMAESVVYKKDDIDIMNCSWGFETIADVDVEFFLFDGVTNGRKKKGVIYVFANGNGGPDGMSSAYALYH